MKDSSLASSVATTAEGDAMQADDRLPCNVVGALGRSGEIKMAVNATTISNPTIGWKRRHTSLEDNPVSVWVSNQVPWQVVGSLKIKKGFAKLHASEWRKNNQKQTETRSLTL
jgi:hypothetical protein